MISYTHETEYLEKGGKCCSKVIIADICYGGCYGCEVERGLAGGLAHCQAREKVFFILILA